MDLIFYPIFFFLIGRKSCIYTPGIQSGRLICIPVFGFKLMYILFMKVSTYIRCNTVISLIIVVVLIFLLMYDLFWTALCLLKKKKKRKMPWNLIISPWLGKFLVCDFFYCIFTFTEKKNIIKNSVREHPRCETKRSTNK